MVAGQRQRGADPRGIPLHPGHDRDLGFEERPDHPVGRGAEAALEVAGARLGRLFVMVRATGTDLRAGAEVVAAAPDRDDAHRVIGDRILDRGGDHVEHRDGHRVALVGPVQRDPADRAVVDYLHAHAETRARSGAKPRSWGSGARYGLTPTGSTWTGSSSGRSSTHTWGRCSRARCTTR